MIYSSKINVKLTLIVFFFIMSMTFFTNFCHAFDLDETVDDDIRKNYNSSKLTEQIDYSANKGSEYTTLPKLPATAKQTNGSASQNAQNTNSIKQTPQQNYIPTLQKNLKINKGKKFKVKNTSKISDYQKAGTRLKFVTENNTYLKGVIIPSNTTFYGEVVESHQPQFSCNGGLVVIKVRSMIYKGRTIPINAYVIRANDKKIFFNNIKGKRTYLQTLYKKGNWGRSLFGRMLNLTVSLGKDTSTLILSPFPFLYGTICFGANTLISPLTAFFCKGGHVSIPAYSEFILKIEEDTWIN